MRQHGFKPSAQRLRQNRRAPVSGDADDQRRTVDDRAELKIRKLRPIDDIRGNAGGLRRRLERLGELFGVLRIRCVGDGERRAAQIFRREAAPDELQGGMAPRKLAKVGAGISAIDFESGPGGAEKFGLPQGGLRASGQNDLFALEAKENRHIGQPLHERPCFLVA